MIIETTHSIYEVRTGEKRFRRIHEFGLPDSEFPVGTWFSYQRMTEPEVGEPVRFFWIIAQAGRMSRIGLCETSPVVRYLADEHAAQVRAESPRRRAANNG